MDLISVIIPVYNVEKYLDRCIESVMAQDYANIEVILVDDGSTDSSAALCDKWLSLYPNKIIVLHQENKGASIARKNGIEAAKGEFLTFVDSDDYVLPQYVSALYKASVENNASVAVCDSHKRPTWNQEDVESFKDVNVSCFDVDKLFHRFFKYEFWGLWGGIYKKSLLKKLIYPEATVNEDYFVKAQMFTMVDKIGYCPKSLYVYEIHPGSLSNLKLSCRALGEFDNAVATWRYITKYKPQYSKHALAIAAEASSKWLGAISQSHDNKYNNYKLVIKSFLTRNFVKIIFNRYLLWKVKIILCLNLLRSL